LETGIRDRFAGRGNNDDGTGTNEGPTLLEFHINKKTGEFSIEHLTTMHQGKSLVPEELIAPFLGDSSEFPVPIHVVRKELYVCRGGAYHSPISEGVVQKQL
jgi:hypothetical protein